MKGLPVDRHEKVNENDFVYAGTEIALEAVPTVSRA
jgi:hypothetical protein